MKTMVLVLVIFVLSGMVFMYQTYSNDVRKDNISNAANKFAPLVSECLDKSSTLECLGQLKLIADKATFEATQKVALEQ